MSVSIIGPFNQRDLVVHGWSVPFLNVVETDGGRVHFTVDHRMGYDVSVADFEAVACLLSDAIAVAQGMASHPRGDLSMEERQQSMGHLHTALRPSRMVELGAVHAEDEPAEND